MTRDEIGRLHVTFEYTNRVASQRAMNKAMPAMRGLGVYHYMTWDGRPRITAIGEPPEGGRELGKLRRILQVAGAIEVDCDPEVLEGMRERRWRKALRAAAGEIPARTQAHHEHGAILTHRGDIIPRYPE